jgi:hypothetical protein
MTFRFETLICRGLLRPAQNAPLPFRAWNHYFFVPFSRSGLEAKNMLTVANIQPLVALIAGILILLVPRLLNYIVAIYLILVGIVGLGLVHR